MASVASFDLSTCRSLEFRIEVRYGFLFVKLDGGTAPLVQSLASTPPFIRDHHPERHTWPTDEKEESQREKPWV